MNRTRTYPCWAAALASLILLTLRFASGCAVPLAPGYKVTSESPEIHFVPGSPPKLEIQTSYSLANSGTTPLPFIDVKFPQENTFGLEDRRIQLDGHPANLVNLPEEYRHDNPDTLRFPFESPWPRGQTRQAVVEYSLSAPKDSGSRITIGSDNFHLGSRGWSAPLQPPRHFLAPYPKRPDKMVYSVRVPSDFLLLARGTMIGRKLDRSESVYRFRLRKDDLAPYVVAGRYTETPFRRENGTVIFWTLRPLKENAGSAPQRISRAWNTLVTDFGPLDPTIRAVHIVESPDLRSHFGDEADPGVAAFPGGALVNDETLGLGIASDDFVAHVSHALAHNWFGDQMYPTGAAGLAMSEGLPEYATIVIDEAQQGRQARSRRVREYLSRYLTATRQAEEKPLGVTTATDPPEQQAIALSKAPLMYVALEDECGEAPVRQGLKHLVTLLRGQEVGFDDLRSAVETACGKDLGELFRAWLYNKGLPSDFPGRYAASQNGSQ